MTHFWGYPFCLSIQFYIQIHVDYEHLLIAGYCCLWFMIVLVQPTSFAVWTNHYTEILPELAKCLITGVYPNWYTSIYQLSTGWVYNPLITHVLNFLSTCLMATKQGLSQVETSSKGSSNSSTPGVVCETLASSKSRNRHTKSFKQGSSQLQR